MDRSSYIFGVYPVLEALNSDQQIDKIYLQKGFEKQKGETILKKAEALGVTINIVPQEKLDKLTRSNHQGVVAIASPISFPSLENVVEAILQTVQTPLFLILDQISDVRNFGAIIRTAECTGVHALIIQKKEELL